MTSDNQDIETFISDWLKDHLEQDVELDANFGAIGMDSLDAVQLIDDLAQFVGVDELPISLILEHPTTAELAKHVANLSAEAVA
jgi:acyl carrier protein